ncbi:MAG: DarT ssDNA thymidine ADP-ribosyltransferase family protein, partial [Methanoregula sp.]|nr:DarT ssDNA thymidine ADP-ribosyltransferase family protein [Methanoregula sp.]
IQGIRYLKKSQYSEAIEAYETAKKINPSINISPLYAEAWNNRGTQYLLKGQFAEALKEFDRALEIDPNYQLSKTNREIAHRRLRKSDKEKQPNKQLQFEYHKKFPAQIIPCVHNKKTSEPIKPEVFQDVLEKKYNITLLWHFIRPDNLDSILTHGILSRNECKNKGIPIADISDSDIQSHRVEYHRYAPLFFAPCPPMIYRIMCENGGKIVALGIDPKIMDLEKNLFSDGNVRVKHTKIFNSVTDLDKLDWSIIHRNPEESKPFQTSDQKREHSAEVLVECAIPPAYIKSLSVRTLEMYNYVKEVLIKNGSDIRVSINLEENGVNILRNS